MPSCYGGSPSKSKKMSPGLGLGLGSGIAARAAAHTTRKTSPRKLHDRLFPQCCNHRLG